MNTTLTSPRAGAPPSSACLAAFEALERRSAASAPPWLRGLRKSGIAYFDELGFPTPADEEWRFTNVAPIAAFPFQPASPPGPRAVSAAELTRLTFEGLSTYRLVLVDGHFAPELSRLPAPADSWVLTSLATAIRDHPALVEPYLGRTAQHAHNAFNALNTAFLHDGAFLYLRKDTVLEAPIHLLLIATQAGTVNQPRHLLITEAGTRASVLEDYVCLTHSPYLTNAVTEIFTGENSSFEHLKIQREALAAFHVATVEAHHQPHSRMRSHSIALGARLARTDLNLRFQGQGCEGLLNGLFFAAGDQLIDHHTLADHAQPHCASHEFYHGILTGRAKGVFNGKILVRKDAQKTDAKQTNKNLLLSAEASINSKPQLEIFADDVKCTHGATVGQLDEEAIFYLRSRGIGVTQARQMLLKGFAGHVLDRLPFEPVRRELDRLLAERLEASLTSTFNRGDEPEPLPASHHV